MSYCWDNQLAWSLPVLALKIPCPRKPLVLGKLGLFVTLVIKQVPTRGTWGSVPTRGTWGSVLLGNAGRLHRTHVLPGRGVGGSWDIDSPTPSIRHCLKAAPEGSEVTTGTLGRTGTSPKQIWVPDGEA